MDLTPAVWVERVLCWPVDRSILVVGQYGDNVGG